MNYKNIQEGCFENRPNRFIAYVSINGKQERVHVKNTGRCQELLHHGAQVYLEKSESDARKTAYDLVAVRKNGRMINMDSQAPNAAVYEWLREGNLFENIVQIKPETKFGNSRFDFFVQTQTDKILIEVKGVTLEQDNIVYFPDAPSERALRHVTELMEAMEKGYRAYILFVVQMEDVKYFSPNHSMQPLLAEALRKARDAGVKVLAYDCKVTPDSMSIREAVPVRLSVLDEIATPLLDWYDRGRRILPWREEPTPYHVWVSEIMLQQTRVEAVKPYYDRFMSKLHDIKQLAEAREEVLLKLWEGLGYYNRVRNMKKAAQFICAEYDGRMPQKYEELIQLPGIGSYTAGAISSIAYGQAVPAVDGNVLRVLARLRSDSRDITSQSVKRQVEAELKSVMPPDRTGDFNQALMELGAMVCIPNGEPHCSQCPWENICSAHLNGEEICYPVKKAKKARTIEEKTVLIVRDQNMVALQKRPMQGLLAGMYEFPCLEGQLTRKQVLSYLKQEGLSVLQIEKLPNSKHIFTHKEWHMIGYAIRVDELAEKAQQNLIFAEAVEVRERYPIPSAYRVYVNKFMEML